MLAEFVTLYRLLNNPPLQKGGLLEFNHSLDFQLLELLNKIADSGIEVEDIEQEDKYLSLEEANANNTDAKVTLRIPTNGEYNIFGDIYDLLNRSVELVNGRNIPDFYVCNDDYWYSEKSKSKINNIYENLDQYCKLAEGLEKLASYYDKKQNDINHKLVFISNDETQKSKAVVLRPYITLDLLRLDSIDISIIKELTSKNSEKQANINRERAIFKVSIIEFFETISSNKSEDNFNQLIHGWDELTTLYNNNFETYMSGFAFHKAKKEVADVELKVAEQYSKVLGDIAGKLFGLPVSFAALLGFFTEKATIASDTLIIVGIISASWLMSRLVANQIAQLQRITHAKEISFGSIEGKSAQYPEDLKKEIAKAKKAIDSNAKKLNKDLSHLSILVWAPLSIGLFLYTCRHRELIDAVINFMDSVWNMF